VYETGNPSEPQPDTARRRWMFGLGIAAVVCGHILRGSQFWLVGKSFLPITPGIQDRARQ